MSVQIPKLKDDYFRNNFIVLNVMGVILKDVKNPFLFVLSRIYMVTMLFFCYYMFATLELIDLIKNFSDFDHTAFNLAYLLSHVLGSFTVRLETIN